MSKPPRLARAVSANSSSKLPSSRRKMPALVAKVPATGTKTGSERTHTKGDQEQEQEEESQPKSKANPSRGAGTMGSQQPEFPKGNLKVTSSEDAENLRCKQASAGTVSCASGSGARGHAKSSRGALPRRHTVGGPRSSQEILAMQPSVMDKKREAFLEHLKQKYPNHASAIMGHQERLREQNRSARAGVACPSPVPAFVDQPEQSSLASLDALEVMSECDMPVAFTRGSRSRASLPVVRSANQTKDSSLGVLYLQYGDDTKQIRMPNEITSVDTVRALFVSAFPQQLSMKMLESPSTAIYVKDDMRNMYYELSDVRGITDQSCLKVYHKDPAQAFSHAARPSNGDARMHRELMYASRDAPPLMRQPSQGAPAPPNPHSMPSSPSRIPFGPRSSGSGATIPRERPGHPLATPTRSASPCPSAILERRDVKPDEDLAAKGLVRGGEALYGDPFMLHHHAPPPETLDLAYHRAAIRTYGVPGMPMEPVDHHSLFRQKSWKTPPSSPHRMGDMRMMEIHASQAQGTLGLERSSPIRQSFRKDGPVAVDKGRSAMGSPVTPDLQAHGNLVTPADPQTRERMRAMEEQIASLTGLVQHALLKGPSNSRGDRENASDISVKSGSPVHSTSSTGGSPVLGPKIGTIVPDSGPAQTPPMHSTPLQVNLHHFRKNVSELRFQLQKMRQLQLQNQEFVHAQIKQAAQEINLRLVEALKRQEDPSHRQRVLVEEERHKYLNMEEKVLEQLGDLERYVESLKKDSTPRAVTLKEVEEGAVGLRKVGESLAGLKGEFPGLQTRMRAVLRVEVEAVKFLKEEPHKLDSMLKRVKTLTDALSTLRKCATEGLAKPSDPVSNTTADEVRPVAPAEFHDPVTFLEPQNSSVRSEAVSSSPGLIHRTQSSSVPSRQSQQTSRPSPTPESATKQSGNTEKSISAQPEHGTAPSSSSNGVSLNKACRNGAYSVGGHDGVTSPSLFIEEIMSHSKKKNRATSIEAAEREWEDRRQNLGHYDSQEFERMLQEAEANMLRGIPSLEVPDKSPSLPVPTTMPPVAREELVEKPKYSAPAIQDDKQPAAPSSDKSTKTEKASKSHHPTEKPAKSAVLDRHLKPNLTNKTSLDRGAKAQDKAAKLNQGSEKANKSPPPPPPRKNYTTPTGMTTTRSGDVVYTSRRESGSAQEGEADAAASAPQPKPKSSPEVKPKPCTPPVTTSAMVEEDDEGDKIMAELQHNTEIQENKDLVTDETGNSMVRKTPGVIYYVTAQISKEPPEDSTDHRATSHSSASQVSHVNASDKSQNQQQVSTDGPSDIPDKGNVSSDLPYKPFTRSSSLKSKTQSPTEGPGSPTQGKVQVFKVPQVQVSIQERVESPTSICSPVSLGGPDLNYSQATVNSSEQSSANQKPVVSSSKIRERQYKEVEDENETFLSPDLSGEEPPPPPPDNIAFMITNTKVQALSTGEYQELVNAKKGNVQTVTVGSRPQTNRGSDSNSGNVGNSNGLVDAEASGYSKKPVIIIFDEPMDIRSAYKRLSTIFECEEELERMLAEERIEEESEENEEDEIRNAKQEGDKRDSRKPESASRSILSSSLASEGGILTEDARHDVKKKSKFKFPTKQLAALTQAIRNGTKTGKKTLQVVVYEDEEESDGSIKQHKETKRFEIASKQEAVKPEPVAQETHGRTEEIRKSTYKTLDSLEQTIRQLESTINEMGPRPSEDLQAPEQSKTQDVQGAEDKVNPPKTLVQKPSSSSKRPGLRKKPKPQLLPRPAVIPTKGVSVAPAAPQQNASVASPTSRMPVPVSAKARQQPGTTDRERATKQQKLQDSQRQFRQANGSAKRSGGDPKSTSPTMPASKIPAFSSGKGASQSDATNHVNHSSSSCSSSSSSSPSKSSIPTPRSLPVPSSHMASLSNGSVKLTPPTHTTKALSLSTQSQNGRPSSSFSSSSHPPLSPTMLSQGAKSVRTIHTPSFVSYNRPHNGSAGKSAIPTATVAKETSQNA